VSEGLAQGPYVVARVGLGLSTFRTQGTEPTTGPPCPTFTLTIYIEPLGDSEALPS